MKRRLLTMTAIATGLALALAVVVTIPAVAFDLTRRVFTDTYVGGGSAIL